ncbi:hypothetical protein [Nostoc sp. 'Lobaria pulmonaria (5183) cyanobiont']|uniref:hypothetical protein n=1 Tax=Nostoc sp. 'Lobaria pulmonaria (5183) cyanobiont' TaxID=1618022 RepID=UPI000D0C5CAA|nr:hypothetical protein [Nostoc sp. 'Lobaria pulmonaria (5183) cyanobiont']AVH72742.1 hypothetical protein NLP_4306 [Nostoc sp. 'Lobaria pulmonaria (5183) cyanobiont']
MEHWQFLIQKQGARSWHILESPNLEILEGQYRVLARSNLLNTDVEVRVTHSSTEEVQPTRRIFKRSRRTNSEGLMPIIPFTYFQAGVWELRCSGDLMSDLLGKSWQYSVQVQVFSLLAEREPRKNLESSSPDDRPDNVSDNLECNAPAETAITLFTFEKAIAVSEELATIDSNLATTVAPDEGNLESNAPPEPVIELNKAIAVSEELATIDSNLATTVAPDEGNLESNAPLEPVIELDGAIAVSEELATTDSNLATTVAPDEGNLESNAPLEPVIELDGAIAVSEELAITDSNLVTTTVVSDKTEEDEDIVIDEPVSPVWLQGETAEQILQNLIDLALPASELLLKDEKVTDSSATQLPPPLLLTLNQDNYIARWGQALIINGYIEFQEKTNLDWGKTLSPKSLRALEVEIELRSPKNLKILTKVRQPLSDKELPFTINTSIDIPADCESKLILADISLYGKFADAGEVMPLASESFTITADVTELLAITATVKRSTSLNDPITPSDSSTVFTETETPVSRLDLKLLNLVKTPKIDQSQIVRPSPNTPLPPQINLQVLREANLRTSKLKNSSISLPQLPKLPPIQSDANIPTDIVAEPQTQEKLVEKDSTIATINLEQLVIKQRRMPIIETTLPYLKRLQALPDDAEEKVENNVPPDGLEVKAAEDLPKLDATMAEDENTPELVVGDAQFQEESVAEGEAQQNTQFQEESVAEVEATQNTQFEEESVSEVEAPQNAQLITTGNLYSSPLLRKWMQSQGYSLPESINDLQPQDYNNYVPAQQIPLSPSAENANIDVNLPLELDANTENNLSEGWSSSQFLLTETRKGQETWEEVEGLAPELENLGEDIDTAQEMELGIGENTEIEKVLEEPTISSALLTQIPPPPPPIKINIASAWLAQEIVVDDTDTELEGDTTGSYTFEEKEQPLLYSSSSLPIIAAATEPLPIPHLYVPEGELIAGKPVIVRVVLPEVPLQVVVKLWLEDYQTRYLLNGPHLLTNLLPNASGGFEVMTQLNIPFGCLEIRLEAIALDLTTQQESHKVTIVRTVIPPDLPSLQLDELLGM